MIFWKRSNFTILLNSSVWFSSLGCWQITEFPPLNSNPTRVNFDLVNSHPSSIPSRLFSTLPQLPPVHWPTHINKFIHDKQCCAMNLNCFVFTLGKLVFLCNLIMFKVVLKQNEIKSMTYKKFILFGTNSRHSWIKEPL